MQWLGIVFECNCGRGGVRALNSLIHKSFYSIVNIDSNFSFGVD